MTKPQTFEKPMGFRDFPPLIAEKKRLLEDRVREQFVKWGYQEVCTPALEFFGTVGQSSQIPVSRMFKCMDRDGNLLVLRPDQTAPIARLVTSVLKREPLPLRLFYHGTVFRAQEKEAGRNSEKFQSGVELVGQAGPEADGEVIALAVESLQACGIGAPTIVLSHVGLLEGFLRERIHRDEAIEKLKETLEVRDLVAFRRILEELDLSLEERKEIMELTKPGLEGKDWQKLSASAKTEEVRDKFCYLKRVWDQLQIFGCMSQVKVDLSLVGSLGYYTGVYFEGYAEGMGFPLVSGGRYDQLYQSFHTDLPATGFALNTDRLLEASPLKPVSPKRIAVFYEPHLQQEAYRKVRSLREEGCAVIMQPVESRADRTPDVDEVLTIAGEGEWSTC
jgi:ATP phosphoribosyltransferase regulatory subunit